MRLSEIATLLADDLREAGLVTKDHVPAKVVPPVVIISTGDPYIEETDTFDQTEFKVNMELYLVTGTATNSAATVAINEMIEKVIFNLGDWDIAYVSPPFMGEANGNMYLSARIRITNTFTIGGN